MRHWSRPLFRFCLVLALGGALGSLATQPDKPRVAKSPERPQIVILATVMEQETPDHCLIRPPVDPDAAKPDEKSRPAKKILACG